MNEHKSSLGMKIKSEITSELAYVCTKSVIDHTAWAHLDSFGTESIIHEITSSFEFLSPFRLQQIFEFLIYGEIVRCY